MIKKRTDKSICADAAAICLFIAAAAYWLWFARRVPTVVTPDEEFYYTLVRRFAAGDCPIVDEWHVSQLSMLVFLPLYKLYLAVNGSADGTILFFRLVYGVMKLGVCSGVYLAFRRRSAPFALLCAVFFFAPDILPTVSYYNTLSIFACCCALLLFCGEKIGIVRGFFAGVFLSAAVLCAPGVAFVYPVIAVCVLLRVLIKKKREPGPLLSAEVFAPRVFAGVTVGVALCAACFAAFLLGRATPGELLRSLPMLAGDDMHNDIIGHLGEKAREFFATYWPAFAAAALFIAALIYQKKRAPRPRRGRLFVPAAAFVLFAACIAAEFFTDKLTVRYYQFFCCVPLVLFAVAAYPFTKRRGRDMILFLAFGVLVTLGADALSNASLCWNLPVACLPAIFIMRDVFKDTAGASEETWPGDVSPGKTAPMPDDGQKNSPLGGFAARALTALCAVALLAPAALDKIFYYPDATYSAQNAAFLSYGAPDIAVDFGAMKGMLVNEEFYDAYSLIYGDIEAIKKLRPGAAIYFDGDNLVSSPLAYIDSDAPFCCYTSYLETGADDKRLTLYWQTHPDRIPDAVYVPKGVLPRDRAYVKRTLTPEAVDARIAFFESQFDCETVELSAGRALLRR